MRVRITLSNPQSGELNGSLLVAGSVGKTSIAAPARCLLASASHSAGISTTVPREALISSAPGFISASSSAPIMFFVEAFPARQAHHIAHVQQIRKMWPESRYLTAACFQYRRQTCIPSDSARIPSCVPIGNIADNTQLYRALKLPDRQLVPCAVRFGIAAGTPRSKQQFADHQFSNGTGIENGGR